MCNADDSVLLICQVNPQVFFSRKHPASTCQWSGRPWLAVPIAVAWRQRLELVDVAGATRVECLVTAGRDEAVPGTHERFHVRRRHHRHVLSAALFG